MHNIVDLAQVYGDAFFAVLYQDIDSSDKTTKTVCRARICTPLAQPQTQTMRTVSSGALTTTTVQDSLCSMTTAISEEWLARTILVTNLTVFFTLRTRFEMIVRFTKADHSFTVQSFAGTIVNNVILFITTSTMLGTMKWFFGQICGSSVLMSCIHISTAVNRPKHPSSPTNLCKYILQAKYFC